MGDATKSEDGMLGGGLEPVVRLYDQIAEGYDALWTSPSDEEENRMVAEIVGGLARSRNGDHPLVLDVGCGTGLALDLGLTAPSHYVGIDPSASMLGELVRKHPAAHTIYRAHAGMILPMLEHAGQRFDLVLALFAAATYLSPGDWMAMTRLTRPGGTVVLMTYESGYLPDYWVGPEREKMLVQVAQRDQLVRSLHYRFPNCSMPVQIGRFLLTMLRP